MKNFAITGVAGFVAPRHLEAIRATGNRLVAAADPHDAVGILDRYGFDVRFFTEIERFDRHLEKLRRGPAEHRVHFLSVCSPNYLHDAHIRMALRVEADTICEKPIVINPWNLDSLQELEGETGRRVYTILQLRLHPALLALRKQIQETAPDHRFRVKLVYITSRGSWYQVSWKGVTERSGGLATNIGIHFFDMLLWLFGPVRRTEVHVRDEWRAGGTLELARADVEWFLSANSKDLPPHTAAANKSTFRTITVDGQEVEFSEGFTDLHTRSYEEVLAGRGFGIADARASIELARQIRQMEVKPASQSAPFIGAPVLGQQEGSR
jgi:UDP-N-acetyl-2-amino-2-deoxyglucuronate dehydrogenase